MTLVFSGATSAEQQKRLERAAGGVSVKSFTLRLDTTGYFKVARVAWLGSQSPHPRLIELQEKLQLALSTACPEHPAFLAPGQAYWPHLTLYRHIKRPLYPERFAPIAWPADSFCLIESRPGIRPLYKIINQWRVSTASPDSVSRESV